jgi:hypothetical protein
MRGREGVCGVCGVASSGVRLRHAQGAYVCGICDDGRRVREDYSSEWAWEFWRPILSRHGKRDATDDEKVPA